MRERERGERWRDREGERWVEYLDPRIVRISANGDPQMNKLVTVQHSAGGGGSVTAVVTHQLSSEKQRHGMIKFDAKFVPSASSVGEQGTQASERISYATTLPNECPNRCTCWSMCHCRKIKSRI